MFYLQKVNLKQTLLSKTIFVLFQILFFSGFTLVEFRRMLFNIPINKINQDMMENNDGTDHINVNDGIDRINLHFQNLAAQIGEEQIDQINAFIMNAHEQLETVLGEDYDMFIWDD